MRPSIPGYIEEWQREQATFRDQVALEALKCSLIQMPNASNRMRCEASYALADEMIQARNKRYAQKEETEAQAETKA